jgi:ABC-type dipeptide/oligopeptide/nickel transport system ATPase subunit
VDLDARLTAQQAALARAEANVDVADAQVSDAPARAAHAATQAKRYGELARQGAASEEVSDTKRQEQLVSEAAVASARAGAEAARKELARARADADAIGRQRSNLRLVAPVDGLVSARNADPGSTVVAGQPVIEVIDPTTLWVNVRFDQLRAAGLRAGLPARIALRSRTGAEIPDNVALLPMLAGRPEGEARKRAKDLLEALDVGHRAGAMPSRLSGGEQQRVAIARALVNRPPVILADEPTAPLDSARALAVIRILNDMARRFETAVIVVTHDEKIIPTFRRIYHIRDGRTEEEAGEGRAIA